MTKNQRELQIKYDAKEKETTLKFEGIIEEMKENYFKEKVNIENSYKKQLSSMQQRYTCEMAQNKKESDQRQEKLRKDFDSIVVGLRSEKNAEERLNIKLQGEIKSDRNRYLGDIYDLKANISQLEQTIR